MSRPVGSKNKPKTPIVIDSIEKLNLERVNTVDAKRDALAMLHMIATAAWESPINVPLDLRIMACKLILDVDPMELEDAKRPDNVRKFSLAV